MDLLVDQDTGDIIFENGKTLVTSCEAGSVAQRVYIHLRTFQSEWFMNLTYGVPWLQLFSKKGITKSYIDRVLQEEVYRVEGVREVLNWGSVINTKERNYSVTFNIKTVNGGLVSKPIFVCSDI